jgi:hypothetical protein
MPVGDHATDRPEEEQRKAAEPLHDSLRDEHDLAVRVPLLQLGERVADLFEWIGRGNWDLDLSRRDELGHL